MVNWIKLSEKKPKEGGVVLAVHNDPFMKTPEFATAEMVEDGWRGCGLYPVKTVAPPMTVETNAYWIELPKDDEWRTDEHPEDGDILINLGKDKIYVIYLPSRSLAYSMTRDLPFAVKINKWVELPKPPSELTKKEL